MLVEGHNNSALAQFPQLFLVLHPSLWTSGYLGQPSFYIALLCAHLPTFHLPTFLSATSSSTLCLYHWVMAECALALVALTGPDKRRSASICQPLHLWAAQSRGELASLFVLSPSWDRPAAKGSLQVHRSSTPSHTHTLTNACTQAQSQTLRCTAPHFFVPVRPAPFYTCN